MATEDKPEALRLADRIDKSIEVPMWCGDAADELRRQHDEIQRLKNCLEWVRGYVSRYDPPGIPNHLVSRIDEALKEQTP